MQLILLLLVCMFAGDDIWAGSFLSGSFSAKLDNGVKVILKENHDMPLVSIQVWIRAGSVNENPSINGISHLMEHMMFKGTKSYTGGQIAKTVESWGGSINAATSDEYTFYYIDIPAEAKSEALKILFEIASSPVFPADELEKEKLVVIEEIYRKQDSPHSNLWDELRPLAYKDTAYKYSVIGDSDVVKNIKREDIVNYYNQHYKASNMVVVVVGDIQIPEFYEEVRGYFSQIEKSELKPVLSLTAAPKDALIVKKTSDVNQIYFMGGFIGPDIESKDQYALDCLAVILGGSGSSRMRQEFYEEKGLVWSIGCGFYTNIGSGLFTVTAELKKDKTDDFLDNLDKLFYAVADKGISKRELEKAKKRIKMDLVMAAETNNGIASTIGYYAVYNKEHIIESYLDNLDKLKTDDLLNAARLYLKPANFIRVMISPDEKTK